MMLAHVTYQQAGNYTCVPVGLYDDYEVKKKKNPCIEKILHSSYVSPES